MMLISNRIILAFIGFMVLTESISAHDDFVVALDSQGHYEVRVKGQPWLRGVGTFVTSDQVVYSTSDGSLTLVHSDTGSGHDTLGPWNVTSLYYEAKSKVRVKVMVRWYRDLQLVLFGQHITSSLLNCSHGNRNTVSTGFPSFMIEDSKSAGRDTELGYLAYGGIMTGDTHKHIGMWSSSTFSGASGLDSGPLVLFDQDDHSIIISPFNNFMATSVKYALQDGVPTASWGVMGNVNEIPAGYETWTAVVYSHRGTNKLMNYWGDIMRWYYNKETSYTRSDLPNNYIGYWTDNGAYYYYATEPGLNYQDTILAVKKYADKENIPYKYVQYDSWWYPKGVAHGVTEWTAMMSVFPDGLRYMWEQTGWPVVAHNRWWSNYTSYAKQNGGQYNFIVENKTSKAIPVDQRFWDDLLTESKKWGLITYEQDWLNAEFDEMDVTVESLKLGDQWLHQMGSAARRVGMTVQYCMSPTRHILTSLQLPAVTQTRVTDDYQPGEDVNWRIGISSMLASAVGLAPFKDNFWTTTTQPGNPYNKSEPYPALNSLIATLTTGPVGPSDRIGYSNITLIMRSCRSDGLILKPSKPVMAIDKQLLLSAYKGFRGEVWSTYSYISRLQFGIILGAAFSEQDKVTVGPHEAGLLQQGFPLKTYQVPYHGKLYDFSDNHPITLAQCTRSDFCLWYTTPVLQIGSKPVIILGELSKWVPMSQQRVTSITMTTDDLEITLAGSVGEQVTFTFQLANNRVDIVCKMNEAGSAVLSLSQRKCLSI